MLRGRRTECAALDRLLAAVRIGESRVLVLRGEPGIGKSALLGYAGERAAGCRVVRAAGVQSEMELAFAGLHQLCAPLLDRLDRLPVPQRNALATALGVRLGDPPDPFLVGLAALSLLSDAAEEQPLVCLIDDAQWLDRASVDTLAFVARRVLAESVALVFATRDSAEKLPLRALPALVVAGLRDDDARALLESALPGRMDDRVRERIVAELHGNPLALLELPRALTPADVAGGFGLLDAPALSGRIEESFQRRLEGLPEETRLLLTVAAADPVGEPALVRRAAARLGLGPDAAKPATHAGLVEFAAQVRFRHPLVRSAVYRAAAADERRRAHEALAAATDPDVDPDRRAWHRARGAAGPDEEVAAELQRSAGRAQARGGRAAAAVFLTQAARLTPDPARRGERALAAAEAKLEAGAHDAALVLLAEAEAGPALDELATARVDLIRARAAFAARLGGDAPALLLQAAKRLEPLDAALARDTYLEAISAAQFAGPLAKGAGLLEAATAARAAPTPGGPPRPADVLLDGLAAWFTEGSAAGAPLVKRALGAFRDDDMPSEDSLRWGALASRIAGDGAWDHEGWEALLSRQVRLVREAGALSLLPAPLLSRIYAHIFAGELAAATSLSEELRAVTEATGTQLPPYAPLGVAAWRGRESETLALIDAMVEQVVPQGQGLGLTATQWAAAVLYNGLGRYDDALAAVERSNRPPLAMGFAHWALVEMIEAAVRAGEREAAADGLDALTQTTRPSGTDWALGVEARSRALLCDDEEADRLYREAIERLGRTRVRTALARSHLVYGEWLRRKARRVEAREQLRTAHQMLTAMGADAFGGRAARELLATGERVRKRTVERGHELTPQEAQIAGFARDGLSNPEIASRLFISPRTVEYHLRKVFAKLNISSRHDLGHALPAETQPAEHV
jgi:DNA-binding CsgD family transcriptional regulator